MNVSQKEKDAVRAGNVNVLEEILTKELNRCTESLIGSVLDHGHDNRLKGKCLTLKEVLTLLKG